MSESVSGSQSATAMTKKLEKIVNSKLETDQEILDALLDVSHFYGENSFQNRRNLRRDLERRSLATNLEFLDSFRSVTEQLKTVAADIDAMNECCEAMSGRLRATKQQTRHLIGRTMQLQEEGKRLDENAVVVEHFLAALRLRADEQRAIGGTATGGVESAFFPALARVKQIHADCKHLLRNEHNAAALEIMEQMSAHQEAAYELLYRWLQRECRLLNVDFVEINPLLCQAFETMRERPALFKYSLDEYCTARRANAVRAFIDALTKGGAGGVPKPIELLSHDPLRYVADMLAWTHQMSASELELAQTLLKLCPADAAKEQMPLMMTQITEGVCRPFKIRVEQSLSSDVGPVHLYRLSNLFTFYGGTMAPSMSADAQLLRAMTELKELTLNLFHTCLNGHVRRILATIEAPAEDLAAVPALHQSLLLLRDVLESHDGTLVPLADKKQRFAKVFAAVLDPLQHALLLSATGMPPVALAVYTLNCLCACHSLLSLYQYTDERLEMLQAQIEAHEDVLVSEQAGLILERCALTTIYNCVLQHRPQNGPLCSVAGCDAGLVEAAVEKFDLFLAKPDCYQLPQCQLLSSAKVKDIVWCRTMEAVIAAYGAMQAAIANASNGYPGFIMKSTNQVTELLLPEKKLSSP